MKKRVSINLEESVWKMAQQAAYQKSAETKTGISASQFVEDVIKAAIENNKRIELSPIVPVIVDPETAKTASEMIKEPSTIRKKKIESSKGKDLSPKISKSDEEMLKEKMELIARKKPESLTGWVGGLSKAQQVGKK